MVGPELTGVFAMQKHEGAMPYHTQEMYAFAATTDADAQQRLREHLHAEQLEAVGVFEASGCDVFEDRMRHIGKYVSGTIFQVGHGATRDILPHVIYDPEMNYPEGWHQTCE